MSASRSLCLRSASKLSASVFRRRESAVFFSTDAPVPTARQAAASSNSKDQESWTSEEVPGDRATGQPFDNAGRGFSRKPRHADDQRKGFSRKPRRGDDTVLEIFNDIVERGGAKDRERVKVPSHMSLQGNPGKGDGWRRKNRPVDTGPEGPLLRPGSNIGELDVSTAIARMSRKNIPMRARLVRFIDEIWEPLLKVKLDNHGTLPKHLYVQTTRYLSQLVEETCTSEQLLRSDYVVKLSEIYDSIATPDLRIKSGLLMALCYRIDTSPRGRDKDMHIKQLIAMWKSISQLKRPSQRNKDTQFALPTEEHFRSMIEQAKRVRAEKVARSAQNGDESVEQDWSLETAVLSSIFGQWNLSHARYGIPGLLMTLTTAATDGFRPKLQAELAPLLELVRIALENCNVTNEYIAQVFNESDLRFHHERLKDLRGNTQTTWAFVTQLLNDPNAHWRTGLNVDPDRKKAGIKSLKHYHNQLRAAHQTNNTGVLNSLWKEFRSSLHKSQFLAAEIRSEPEFLDFWYFVWCSSRNVEKLQEVQKVANQIDVQPTIKTYTAMMHGWKLAKDGDKIATLWESLRSSRIPLDTPAWTERISGLIELGKAEEGLSTLADMLAVYKEAERRGQPHNAVQPTIEVINAAFKPLLRIDQKAAHEVLAWAGREGISPDIHTYNILLSQCFKNQEPAEEVQKLLKAMQQHGVQPDGATFTIILEEALGTLDQATSEEQVRAVESILNDIRNAGIRPNLETYGKMLHAVCTLPNGAEDAVEAVLGHMRHTGHTQISPHMALTLVRRIVNRSGPSPNPDAVHSLLNKHGFGSVHSGDQRLWEEVISAYANMGDATRALKLYDELSFAGRPLMRLSALRDLLLLLIETEDMDAGRRVVLDAMRNFTREGPHERRWQHHFWHQAYKYGLVQWDELHASLRRVIDETRYAREQES